MPDIWMDVDVALSEVPVNIMPLIDDTDFKTIEDAIAYDAGGMDLTWNFVTTAGAFSSIAVTPTTGGDYDWAEHTADDGMYTIEIPASGGASANNDTEGFGWFTGVCTGVLPWRGPVIGFRKASMNNVMIDNGTLQDNLQKMYDGTGYVGGTAKLTVDVVKWLGQACAAVSVNGVPEVDLTHVLGTILTEGGAGRLAAAIIKLFDVAVPALVASDVMRGTDGANTTVPDAAGTAPTAVEIQAEMEENGASILDTLRDDLADGGRLDLLIDAIKAKTDVVATAAKLLAYVRLMTRSDAAVETDAATELTEINADEGAGGGDFSSQTDAEEALRDAAAGNVTSIMGTALTETSGGNLANNMSTFWDNADAATAKVVDDVGAPASGGGSPLVLGAGDVGDFKEDGDVHFFWNTIDRSGAAVAPSTAGTLRVYKDDGTGEVTAPTGITDTRAFDGVTGLHECKIDTSANTFYAKEKNYSVVLVGAVIDTKTVNVKIASFSIENRWANVHFHYGGK